MRLHESDPASMRRGRSHTDHTARGNARIVRSKGAMSGFLLVLLGVWGGVIPFVGPYFDFGYTPNTTWDWTAARFWYEVLPAAVTVLGAVLLSVSANRAMASVGAWAAAVSGAWFIVGPVMAPQLGLGSLGGPINTGWVGTLESIGLFFGLGAVILYLASTAIGRLSVKGVRDVRAAERRHEDRTHDDQAAPALAGPADTVHRPRDASEDSYPGTMTRSDTDPATTEKVGSFPANGRRRRNVH